MSITRIKITSREMKRNTRFVRHMVKYMPFDENMESYDWRKARKKSDLFYKLMPCEKKMQYEITDLSGIRVLITTPQGVHDDIVIIYIHGGGFVTGSGIYSRSYCSMLAKYSGCRVYSIDYSMAPEHRFPKGFDECCKVFEHLMEMYPDSDFALVGESAGGNLCTGLAHKYKGFNKIACVIANSPAMDFSGSIDHTINENRDFIVKPGCLAPLRRMYVGDADPTDPCISPILGDFTGYPPVFITCDANETLYSEAMALYNKCVESEVSVQMIISEGGFHAFANTGSQSPETMKILRETVAFINKNYLRTEIERSIRGENNQ